MPFLETPSELAEAIADLCGIYGAGPEQGDHPDECPCRMCWVGTMEDRIREAVRNENRMRPLPDFFYSGLPGMQMPEDLITLIKLHDSLAKLKEKEPKQ